MSLVEAQATAKREEIQILTAAKKMADKSAWHILSLPFR